MMKTIISAFGEDIEMRTHEVEKLDGTKYTIYKRNAYEDYMSYTRNSLLKEKNPSHDEIMRVLNYLNLPIPRKEIQPDIKIVDLTPHSWDCYNLAFLLTEEKTKNQWLKRKFTSLLNLIGLKKNSKNGEII